MEIIPNELMIGDWVSSKEVHTKDYYLPSFKRQVAQIKDNGVELSFTDRYGNKCYITLLYDDIEPIPLTAEILEKNGFERTNDYHFFDGDEYYEMELRELSDSIWFVEYTNLEFSMSSQRMMVCNVHELQHALKLCRIDKEIEL